MISAVSRPQWFLVIAVATVAAITGTIVFHPTQAEQRQSVEHVVEIKDFEFVPRVLHVRVGDTVRWVNRDIVPHTATAKNKSWDTKNLARGEVKTIVVTHDMARDYYCRFHPMMLGRLVIEAAT